MNPKGLVYKKNKVANVDQQFLQQSQILAEQSQLLVKHTLRQNFYWKIALFFILLIVGITASVVYFMFDKTSKMGYGFEQTMNSFYTQQKNISGQQEETFRLREELTKDMARELSNLRDQYEKKMRDLLAKKETSYQELLKSFQVLQKNLRASEQEHQKSLVQAKKTKQALEETKEELSKRLKNAELALLENKTVLKKEIEKLVEARKNIASLERKIEVYKATVMEKLPHKVIVKLQQQLRDDN